MKKNRINTISFREIKHTFKRFISLFVMSALGVGVFVGIKMAAPDMIKSLDYYYDEGNEYDIKIVSTLGLTDDDIKKLYAVKGVKEVYASYSKDVLVKNNGNESVIKVLSITPGVNKLKITDGRAPKDNNEVVVEDYFLVKENLKIGDKITTLDNDTFNETNLTIVGTVKSPLFIDSSTSSNRGNTNLGTGKINYYVYVNSSNFTLDYYTEIYLTVGNAKEKTTNSKEYNKLVDDCLDEINKIKEERQNARYAEIYNEASELIEKNKKDVLDEFDVAEKELNVAGKQLINAKATLDDTKAKLDSASFELNATKVKLDKANRELNSYENELINYKNKIDNAKSKINEELRKYDITLDNINALEEYLNNLDIPKEDIKDLVPTDSLYYDEILNIIDKIYELGLKNKFLDFINSSDKKDDLIESVPKDIVGYEEIIDAINRLADSTTQEKIKDYITNSNNIDEIIDSIPKDTLNYDDIVKTLEFYKDNSSKIFELIFAINEINKAEMQYNEAVLLYENGKKEYEQGYLTYTNYYNEYENGLSQYNNGLSEYNSNFNLYNSKLEEYYNSKKIFELEIIKAKEKLSDIPNATWYVYDRLDATDYSSFISDGESVSNLSKIFPTIFFVVAVLISLISMSRMVEEDRMQIGTLKSLGFSNKHIRKKYLLYSGLATILGGITGALIGFFVLPLYVFNVYKILHDIPYFKYDFTINNIIIGITIAVICICGTTLLTIRKVVKEKPSDLMRPKAPEAGKRVLLERISFIWTKIKFSNKITIRNLFRYKKRVLMTVGGILGCTAVMLVGFGIRDSIVDIPSKQFEEVFYFDDMVYLNGKLSDDELDNIFNNKHIKNKVSTNMLSITVNTYSANLFVPDDEDELKNVLNLKDLETNKKLKLKDNEVIISDKLSSLINKNKGDKLIIKTPNNNEYEFTISAVSENYVGHYVYMNKETYEDNIDSYKTNVVYLNIDDLKNEEKLSKELLDNDNIISVLSLSSTIKNVNDSLSSLNSIVLLLIFLSGALSFVVLYNLSNINISERKREIATLKVLGFTDKEVDNYITKEMVILTIFGILLGLGFGTILTFIIIDTVEIDSIRFLRNINLSSYALTASLIMLFTLIVNKIIHFALKKIDMIESLKSVE